MTLSDTALIPAGTGDTAAAPAKTGTGAGTKQGRGGQRLYALDGLRLLAALSVLFFHYLSRGGEASDAWGQPSREILPSVTPFTDYGWLGVEFFFLISGFVICMSAWGRGLGQFFRSRITRLYPAYWAAIVLLSVATAVFPVLAHRPDVHRVLLNLTMLHEPLGTPAVSGVFWSLWVELRFYLLFALVVWRGVTYRSTVAFCCLWTVGTVITHAANDRLLNNLLVPTYSAYFIAGIGFYLIHRFGSHAMAWGIVGVSWLIAQETVLAETERFSKIIHADLSGGVASAVVTACFVVMAGVALGWFRHLNWRWLTFAGTLTYPLYLVHESLGHLMIYGLHDHLSPATTVAATTVAMLVLAWLLHVLAEKPLARRLKRTLERPLPSSGIGRRANAQPPS
ncbi:acyltransferase family protein [Streptomyces sp. NPDC088732]|uniref:acyltransferase family protein n=1 Tax=Streptomyces sp. NPDC088732 TaxID=3365879 RepID=UPI0038152CDC